MLASLRERLVVALLVLLPLHAFLVTVATRMIAGPEHAPLGILAAWKEGALILVLALAVLEIATGTEKARRAALRVDALDGLLLAFAALAVAVTLAAGGGARMLLLGARYDLVPLAAFFVLRRAHWSLRFWREAEAVIIAAGCAIAGYGLLTLLLPDGFFAWLGYSPLHSLYLPDGPIAAFQHIGSSALRRIQSTMSGPNQLGMWLLLPWSLLWVTAVSRWSASRTHRLSSRLVAGVLAVGFAILFTFSRAAWIAAAVIAIATLWRAPGHGKRLAAGIAIVIVGIVAGIALVRPEIVLRAASSADHVRRPLQAVTRMAAHPLGMGLASAGPASNRVSDACVELPAGSDTAWARPHPELCVFVGGVQAQPADRACSCPFLPENWYLQIGVETGALGFLLFAGISRPAFSR
jgi:hypothetical protein